MSRSFTIRLATRADARKLHDLGTAVTYPTYVPIAGEEYADYVMDTWWRTDYIADSMDPTTHYVAECDGVIVGTAVVGEWDGEPVLWKLYVLPAEHGSGIGSALLEAAVGDLPGDAERLQLSYVDGNTSAAAFYRARGFGYVRTEPDAAGRPDQIWMALPLR